MEDSYWPRAFTCGTKWFSWKMGSRQDRLRLSLFSSRQTFTFHTLRKTNSNKRPLGFCCSPGRPMCKRHPRNPTRWTKTLYAVPASSTEPMRIRLCATKLTVKKSFNKTSGIHCTYSLQNAACRADVAQLHFKASKTSGNGKPKEKKGCCKTAAFKGQLEGF